MASSNNNNIKVVPEAMEALDKFKYEVASDVSVKNIFIKNAFAQTSKLLHIIHILTYFLIPFIHSSRLLHFIFFQPTQII